MSACDLPHYASVLADLASRRDRVIGELHPALRMKVLAIMTRLGGRVAPYCGYRGPHEQQEALASGHSAAAFGQSPHNFTPALACDLVLNPAAVDVRENPDRNYPGFPDLWDDETLGARATWADLEDACAAVGLERVTVNTRRDLPHVQLPGWYALSRAQ